MILPTTCSHGTESFLWLHRVLNCLGDSKEGGKGWFDFSAAASDPANNVTLNLESCPILCRAASLINVSEKGSENDGIYSVTLFCLRITFKDLALSHHQSQSAV